jgi:hypothetical protein
MSKYQYQTGSCIVCGQGTDTAVGVRGEAEWHVAFMMQLGIPYDQANATHSFATGAAPGHVLDGIHTSHVRVCADCFANSPFYPKVKPALYIESGELPVIEQPA